MIIFFMIESPERFPLGLREMLPGLDEARKRSVLRGLVSPERERMASDLNRLINGYEKPIADFQYFENMSDEMILQRIESCNLLLPFWSLKGQDRASALRFIQGLKPDIRKTHFSES